jgi:hypothetical protein
MTVDFGFWWLSQRHLQTQADAGALAGADQFMQNPGLCPGTIKTLVDQYAAPNTTTAGSDPVPASSKQAGAEGGNVTANTTAACPGLGSYVDVSVKSTNPGVLFSGLNPTVTAHARVGLFQVSSAGGSTVLPYAITTTQAQNCCNNLVRISVNASNNVASQSLVCNGSTNPTDTTDGTLMAGFEVNGCPTTQISASPTTCVTTAPPSCLAEFNGVDESLYDAGEITRFENGAAQGAKGLTCANANGSPVSTNYSYQLPALNSNDPRLITIFVVPNGSFNTNPVNMIPIVGYASFYVAGFDHDPCIVGKTVPPACPKTTAGPPPPAGTACDPASPDGVNVGSVWGNFVKSVTPATGGVIGTIPCNPTGDASTADCVEELTQ